MGELIEAAATWIPTQFLVGLCALAVVTSCTGTVSGGGGTPPPPGQPGAGGSGGRATGTGGAPGASGGSSVVPPGSGGATTSTGGTINGTGGGGTATGGSAGRAGNSGTGGRASGGTSGAGGSNGSATGGTTAGTGGATSSGTCPPACGPSVTDFYDNKKLATIRLTMDAADTGTYTPAQWIDLLWSKWNHCPPFDKSDLVRVTFQYESPDGKGNATIKDVGMRWRGSMRKDYNQLQGFKLDFQTLLGTATGPARRRFADNNQLNTLSIEKDPSHMIQCLSYKMMRDFGLPAPYCNHLKVYVNGAYYGLMESVEDPDVGRFHAHHFGEMTGETYEGSPSQGDCAGAERFSDSAAKLLYSGATFSSYTSQYKIARGTTATAEAHLLPMLKCADATQTASDATFKTCISEWLNVDAWLKQIAAESLMPTMESFMVQRNFILYFVPDAAAPNGGRFQLSSWDLDVSFHTAKCYPSSCDPFTATAAYYGPGGTRAKLATRLTTVFRAEYCAAMKSFLGTVYKSTAVDEMSKVIESGMTNDPSTSSSAWQSEVTTMRNFVNSHGTSAMTQVTAACP